MSNPEQTHQLGDGDAIFLAIENERAPSHIGGLSVLDGAGVEDFGFERTLAVIEERIRLVPRFTWKVQEVPFGLDRPYFVEDQNFDPRRHIHRVAVPGRGTMKDLTELASLLHARPLDRSRPLWEAWWIEGLEGGRAAILIKMHHCLLDGEAGVGLAEILMDASTDAVKPLIPDAFREASPQTPTLAGMATNAVKNAFVRPANLAKHARRALRDTVADVLGDPLAMRSPGLSDVPRLYFNDKVGPRRAFATASVSLEEVREVKKHFDVTINDVLLELVGSTLRRVLRNRGELPSAPLVACCPISLRDAEDKSLDNQIGSMAVSMATNLADPADRLRQINQGSKCAKKEVQRGKLDLLSAVGEVLAPKAVEWMIQASQAFADKAPLPGNLVFSNVRGLPIPVYMAGGRVEAMYPMSMLQIGNGVNVTAVSYVDRIDFGFLVDPDLVTDPWELAEGIPAALEALQTSAEGVVHARG